MTHDLDDFPGRTESSASATLAKIVRFLRVVRMRKGIVVCCTIVSCLLGVLYYTMSTPIFRSSAQLLVLKTGGQASEDSATNQSLLQNYMPTYIRLITSDVVLKSATDALPAEHRVDFGNQPPQDWPRILRENMSAASARNTNLIDVSYQSVSPETAAAVVNAVLTSYVKFMDDTHQDGAKELLEVLTRDKVTLERDLAQKERELQALQQQGELVLSMGDQTMNVAVERVVKLNEALVDAQKDVLDTRALLFALEQAVQSGEDVQQYAQQVLGSVADNLVSRDLGLQDTWAMARVQQELLADQAEYRNRIAAYGPNHPRIRELVARIQTTREWLESHERAGNDQLRRIRNEELGPRLLQMTRQKLIKAEAHEQSVRAQFEQDKASLMKSNSRMHRIRFLTMELERTRNFYDLLLERIRDIDLGRENGLRTAVVQEPEIDLIPVSPKKAKIGIVCLFLGTVGGLGVILLLETLDDRFRTPEELKMQLGVPVLAMVRRMEATGGDGIEAVQTFAKPNGVECEAFRTLRTAISFANAETKRLVVTSTEQSDGKTTVMSNLAVAFAQSGKKTLLIDADMRRPGMTGLLELRRELGLSHLLSDERPIADAVREHLHASGQPGLDVIPAGARPVNPAELLASDRLAELLGWADRLYDQILIDAPPILAVTDAGIVGRLADSTVLVTRPDKNRRRMVFRAVESLQMLGIQLIGVVINHLSPDNGDDYYGYGYGYGYGHDDAAEHGAIGDDEYEDDDERYETPSRRRAA